MSDIFTPAELKELDQLKDHCRKFLDTFKSCALCPLNDSGYIFSGNIETRKSLEAAWKRVFKHEAPIQAITDSGDRTQFSSGAVRDMHTGKGRYDLLPWCVIDRLAKHYEAGALKYSDRNWEKGIPAHSFADSAARHFGKYMDGQRDEDHLIAAIWNLCGLAWTEVKRPEMMDIPARMDIKDEE